LTAAKNLPLQRGFNSFFGVLNGQSDFYTYQVGMRSNPLTPDTLPPTLGTNCAFHAGKDLYDNGAPADLSVLNSGRYITELFGERAVAEYQPMMYQSRFFFISPLLRPTPRCRHPVATLIVAQMSSIHLMSIFQMVARLYVG
jgi:hypothetical protein